MSWPLVKLGNVCILVNGDRGKNYPSKGLLQSDGIPFINAGNFTDNHSILCSGQNYISEAQFNLLSSGKVELGDILFCLRGSLGKFAIVDNKISKGAVASSLVIIRANEQLAQRYLKHYLKSPLCNYQIQSFENGAAQPNLSASDLKKFAIPLPPQEEQNHIAEILDRAEALKQKRQQTLKLADELLRATFLSLFGDPITNPKGWPVRELGDLIPAKGAIVDGPFGSSVNTKVDYIDEAEIPVIRTKNVSINGEFIKDDLKFMRRDKYETILRSNVKPGDIILTKVGTIGNLCIFPNDFEEAVLSTTGSCRIRVPVNVVNTTYLYHFLRRYKPKMLEIASAGVQPFLNMKHVKSFLVPLPNRDLQDKFEQIVKKVEALKAKIQTSETEIEHLAKSLSQKAFRGEL